MVDQPVSPPKPRPRAKGKLSLPDMSDKGMNKTRPNNQAIEGRGPTVGPDKDPDPDKRKGSSAEDAKILDRIRKRFERCIAAESENRKNAVEDRKFKAGDQWPADVAAARNTDKRPCLTNNRTLTFVHQVTNPARENRPQINLSPIGDKADKNAAKMFEGLIRAIERDSHADIAYDTALDDAVTSGWGYMRLLTEWKSETSFDQVLVIKRVRNPFTIYLDPDRQEPDGSDSRFGFCTEIIPEDQYKIEYPDAQMIPFDLGGTGEKYRSWVTKDGVRVAEYYEVVEKPAKLVSVSDGYVGYEDDLNDLQAYKLRSGQTYLIDERKSVRRTVEYYKVTALEVLERNEWIGKWVPIIEVVGNEIDIEGKVKKSGIIRDMKDAQRMANYWDTWITEQVALGPKSQWLMEEGQAEGHEQEWKTANVRPRAYLTYKGTSVDGHPAPPPQRINTSDVPQGALAAKQGAEQSMMATTGIRFDSTLQERMYDESGKALRELNRKTDQGSFHYYDNFCHSLVFLGKQLVDAIPKVYVRKQVATILREDIRSPGGGPAEQTVTIDPMLGKAYQETQGEKGVSRTFNPGCGEYSVAVNIGPSYATRRQEAAESMMEFAKALPHTAALIADIIASELDWPGAEKIAARLAKAIPPQFLTADLKDIPPQIQALIQNLEMQSKMMQLELQKAMHALADKQADRDVKMAKVEADYEARLLQIIAKTEDDAKKVAVESAKFTAEMLIEEMRSHRDREHEMEMARQSAAAQPQEPHA